MSNAPEQRNTDAKQNALVYGELLLRRLAAKDFHERRAIETQIRRFETMHMPIGGSAQDLLR